MKSLTIKPDGHLIKGGTVMYNFDENGTVNFSLHLTAHYLFSDHDIAQTGTYQVNPDYLKSAKVRVGEVFKMGKVKLEITEIKDKSATAKVEIEDLGKGSAQVSLAGKLIELMSLSAAGQVFGQSVKLEAK